jgi:hypothetical protein
MDFFEPKATNLPARQITLQASSFNFPQDFVTLDLVLLPDSGTAVDQALMEPRSSLAPPKDLVITLPMRPYSHSISFPLPFRVTATFQTNWIAIPRPLFALCPSLLGLFSHGPKMSPPPRARRRFLRNRRSRTNDWLDGGFTESIQSWIAYYRPNCEHLTVEGDQNILNCSVTHRPNSKSEE